MIRRKYTLIMFLVFVQLILFLSCSDDDSQRFDELIIGKWKFYEVLINDEQVHIPPDSELRDTSEYTSSGNYYYFISPDTMKYTYILDDDKIYVYADTLFRSLEILRLDNDYLWTLHCGDKIVDGTCEKNTEFHHRRLSQ